MDDYFDPPAPSSLQGGGHRPPSSYGGAAHVPLPVWYMTFSSANRDRSGCGMLLTLYRLSHTFDFASSGIQKSYPTCRQFTQFYVLVLSPVQVVILDWLLLRLTVYVFSFSMSDSRGISAGRHNLISQFFFIWYIASPKENL